MTLSLESIKGRAVDLDSHENTPFGRWGDVFGEAGRHFLEAVPEWIQVAEVRTGDWDGKFTLDHGETEITEESVWEAKGTLAPSSVDIGRRPEVLDAMGIQRALIFPAFGFAAFAAAAGGGQNRFAQTSDEQKAAGWAGVEVYNEWAAAITSNNPDRMRMVGILPTAKPGMTLEGLIAETKRQIDLGVRAFFISSGVPPLGISPASVELDPWYAMIAEADIPLTLHAGSGTGFLASEVWARAPQFMNKFNEDAECVAEPLSISTVHLPEEYFISTLVIGGVLERHPTLRIGAIELGGYWIGPLAERLDLFTDPARNMVWAGSKALTLKPSEYIARQVRVTPFVFEPVAQHLERYPHLEDVFCFSTDFPHPEGNKWSMKRFYEQLAPKVSDRFLEKFFITNGQLLVP
ncbi:hypothetical protein CcI49_11535 [Frankia sp. CcI49]|uniref:amidohydrolase family protein n=1 Tax=Frankia sp. CcI49 TaxID=1745382 RepID=UPI000975A35C|nr:amidohydrolase family protein [Frankia sp. CcI49]ONH60455.1 hypothetical protein CcI49_11535 [Frankia sp. CcI49]